MRHDEIVEEISRLTETTANLQKQLDKPKSRLDRFKEYAGVVSLLLSLATGFFAVYTSFVAEPEKNKGEAQAKLHDTLAQLVTLDQEYMKEIQQGDPNANNGAHDADGGQGGGAPGYTNLSGSYAVSGHLVDI